LRSEQVGKQLDRRESRNVDSFKIDDGFLNGRICVDLRSIEGVVIREELVEESFQSGTSLDLSLGNTALLAGINGHLSSVDVTCDLVYKSLVEFHDHLPDYLHLVSLVGGHRLPEFRQFSLGLLYLIFALLNHWLNALVEVSEQDVCQLLEKHVIT